MTYQTISTLRRATLLLASSILLAGCESDPKPAPPIGHDFFPAADGVALKNVNEVQFRNGARADGMLQAYHFEGDKLNSLGEKKLDLLAANDPDAVTTIYMNFPEDEMMNQRRDDVVAYMRGKGREEALLKFVSGPNPATLTPAAPGLARLPRTENINSPLNGGGDYDNSGLSGSTGSTDGSSGGMSGGNP